MPVWQHCLRRAAKRTLELIVLQFFVVVILPDNAVGTSDLPAVGARKASCTADKCTTAPSRGEPAVPPDLLVLDLATRVGEHSLVVSRHPASSAADVLQLSRRLRI